MSDLVDHSEGKPIYAYGLTDDGEITCDDCRQQHGFASDPRNEQQIVGDYEGQIPNCVVCDCSVMPGLGR